MSASPVVDTTSEPRAAEPGPSAAAPLTSYLPMVHKVARRIARRLPSHVRLEDLVSVGVVGLLEAQRRFNADKQTDFGTFAEFRVKGAILDELRSRDVLSRGARATSRAIERRIAELSTELGRQPEEQEIAESLQISVDELRDRLEGIAAVSFVSFEDLDDTDTPVTQQSPFDRTRHTEVTTELQAALSRLSERQQVVLQLYYVEDLNMREIGEVLEVTESRVCQLLSDATVRLRAMLNVEAPAKAPRKGARHG